jgi:hypothetical protein
MRGRQMKMMAGKGAPYCNTGSGIFHREMRIEAQKYKKYSMDLAMSSEPKTFAQ